ncbi:MAG: restriction endonuclease subunit S [Lachnospiraceae bacterium]|nr:restriction endonuclease subunit S [Lachnospiraceae bacterium]
MKTLNGKKWKEFNLIDLFDVVLSSGDNQVDKLEKGTYPLLSSGSSNNGICGFIKSGDGKSQLFKKNIITIDMFGKVYFHNYSFFAVSHGRINMLIPKDNLTIQSGLFISKALESRFKGKYNYSRMCSQKRLIREKIKLPVSSNNMPDYVYMEQYIKELKINKEAKYIEHLKRQLDILGEEIEICDLDEKVWKDFFVLDVFGEKNIKRGKRLTKNNQIDGNTPYVSSTAMNNGVDNFIQPNDKMRIYEDCLSVANSGSVGSSFYEPFEFVASDHVTHLKNDRFNKYIYLFISCMTSRWSDKYNFNREINDKRISREKILLPVNDNNEPDYEYMEQYIKNIMIRKYNQYIEFKS